MKAFEKYRLILFNQRSNPGELDHSVQARSLSIFLAEVRRLRPTHATCESQYGRRRLKHKQFIQQIIMGHVLTGGRKRAMIEQSWQHKIR